MKKVQLKVKEPYDKDSIMKIHRLYSTRLPNHKVAYFKSRREALAFVNLTNKFLTFKVYEWNEIYMDLIMAYRKIWPYLHHHKKGGNTLVFEEREIKKELSLLEKHIDKLTDNFINNKYGVRSFGMCELHAKNVLKLILEFYKRRNVSYDQHIVHMIRTRIDQVDYELQNWSPEKKVIHSIEKAPTNYAKLEVV